MRKIKPVTKVGDIKSGIFFNPYEKDGIKPRCICGYELFKESNDTWRCSGGNHRYFISQGDVLYDKYGNVLLKKPLPNDEKNKEQNK